MVFVKRQKRYHPSLSVSPFVFVSEKSVIFFLFRCFQIKITNLYWEKTLRMSTEKTISFFTNIINRNKHSNLIPPHIKSHASTNVYTFGRSNVS